MHCLWIFSAILWFIFLSFQIPTSKLWENQLLHIFTSICCSYYFYYSHCYRCVLEAHCGFSLYFLVVNEVKYLFILLFAIYKSTLVKCMFIYFLFHLMYCLLLLLLSFEISFYSPGINLFYGVWCANMYSQYTTYLFLL